MSLWSFHRTWRHSAVFPMTTRLNTVCHSPNPLFRRLALKGVSRVYTPKRCLTRSTCHISAACFNSCAPDPTLLSKIHHTKTLIQGKFKDKFRWKKAKYCRSPSIQNVPIHLPYLLRCLLCLLSRTAVILVFPWFGYVPSVYLGFLQDYHLLVWNTSLGFKLLWLPLHSGKTT
jgi:hypothetical protein